MRRILKFIHSRYSLAAFCIILEFGQVMKNTKADCSMANGCVEAAVALFLSGYYLAKDILAICAAAGKVISRCGRDWE